MLRKISLLAVFVLGFCGMTVQARAQLPATWYDANLTALGGGLPCSGLHGSIASLYDPGSNVLRNHYIAADFHVHDLYLDDNGWHDEDVSALGGGPLTLGGIALIYGGFPQVFRSHYPAGDKHVHELSLDAGGWHDADLTVLGGGPLAVGAPATGPIANVFDPMNNVLRIHYLAVDQHVHELYLDATPSWHDADLTVLGGGPLAVGPTITLIYDPVYQVIRSHYVAADQHVHELYLDATPAWHDADLTALGGGPVALAGPLATVFDPYDNVIRSHFLSADWHVHELYLDATPAWHDADLTAQSGGPLGPHAVPGSIALINDAVHHVIRSNYLATDLQVHELYLQK